MANFLDYLKLSSTDVANRNIAQQAQQAQANARLEAQAEQQRQIQMQVERERQRQEEERIRKEQEERARLEREQAKARAEKAKAVEANLKAAQRGIELGNKTVEDAQKSSGKMRSALLGGSRAENEGFDTVDVAKSAGKGLVNAVKGITVNAPAVATDFLTTNLKNNSQSVYQGAIDEFGQAQYDQIMNPDYVPVENTNAGNMFRNNAWANALANEEQALDSRLEGSLAGGFAESLGNQVPTILTGNLLGSSAAGLGAMGTSLFGNSAQEALDRDYGINQAVAYGLANAGLETATETIAPGIPGIDEMSFMGFLNEGLEEIISEYGSPFVDMALGDKNLLQAADEAFSWDTTKKALEAGASGALSAALMNTASFPGSAVDAMTGQSEYRRTLAENPNVNPLAVQRRYATSENLASRNPSVKRSAQQANRDIIKRTASDFGANLSDSQLNDITEIANKVGARVEFTSNKINGADGYRMPDGTIMINASAKNPALTIFTHELTHDTTGTGAYRDLADSLMSMLESGQVSPDRVDAVFHDPNLSDEQRFDEAVAVLAEEVLGNEKAIRNLAESDGNALVYMAHQFKNFVKGDTNSRAMEKVEHAMQKAIKRADTTRQRSGMAYQNGQNKGVDALANLANHGVNPETSRVDVVGKKGAKNWDRIGVVAQMNQLLDAYRNDSAGYTEKLKSVYEEYVKYAKAGGFYDEAKTRGYFLDLTDYIRDAAERGVVSLKAGEAKKGKTPSINEVVNSGEAVADNGVTVDVPEVKEKAQRERSDKRPFVDHAQKVKGVTDYQQMVRNNAKMDELIAKAKQEGKYKQNKIASTFDQSTSEGNFDAEYKNVPFEETEEYKINNRLDEPLNISDTYADPTVDRLFTKTGKIAIENDLDAGDYQQLVGMLLRYAMQDETNEFSDKANIIGTLQNINDAGAKGYWESEGTELTPQESDEIERRGEEENRLAELQDQIKEIRGTKSIQGVRNIDTIEGAQEYLEKAKEENRRNELLSEIREIRKGKIPKGLKNASVEELQNWIDSHKPSPEQETFDKVVMNEKQTEETVSEEEQRTYDETVQKEPYEPLRMDVERYEHKEINEPIPKAPNTRKMPKARQEENMSVNPRGRFQERAQGRGNPHVTPEYQSPPREQIPEGSGVRGTPITRQDASKSISPRGQYQERAQGRGNPHVTPDYRAVAERQALEQADRNAQLEQMENERRVNSEVSETPSEVRPPAVGDKIRTSHGEGEIARFFSNGAVLITTQDGNYVYRTDELITENGETVARAKSGRGEIDQKIRKYIGDHPNFRTYGSPDLEPSLKYFTEDIDQYRKTGEIPTDLKNNFKAMERAGRGSYDDLVKEFESIFGERAEAAEEKPVVEKTDDGKAKVNEDEFAKAMNDLSSDDKNAKETAKESLKKGMETLTDGSEAGKNLAGETADQLADAVDKIREFKKKDEATTETQVDRFNISDPAKNKLVKDQKKGGNLTKFEYVSEIDAFTTAEECYDALGHDGTYDALINRPKSRNQYVSMYEICVAATWLDHSKQMRSEYMEQNNITKKDNAYYKDGVLLDKASEERTKLRTIDNEELEMGKKLAELSHNAGVALHYVGAVLQDASPEAKRGLFDIEIDKVNKRLEKRFKNQIESGKIKLIDPVTDAEWDAYINAETDEARQQAMEAIEKRVGESIPAGAGDVVRSIRYLNMLFNPATHIRNIGSNMMMQQVTSLKNANAYVIDRLASPLLKHMAKKSGKEYVSSFHDANGKMVTVNSVSDRALLDYWDDFNRTEIKGLYNAEKKYSRGASSPFDAYRNYFHKPGQTWNVVGRGLDWISKKNSKALQVEDDWFTDPRFRKEAARITKAEGWTLEDGKLMKGGKEITARERSDISARAMQEAKETTFHDRNKWAELFNEAANLNTFSDILVGGTFPFTTTPFNIARRTYEYSPMGLMTNAIGGYGKVCRGEMSANTYLNNLAKGMTGTQVALLGYMLAKMGLLSGHKKEEWKERAYKQDLGLEQDYSLVIPKEFRLGKNNESPEDIAMFYSIDWGGPSTSAALLGAQAYEILDDRAEREYGTGIDKLFNTVEDLKDLTASLLSPLLDTTMLSSFTGALDAYYYDKAAGGDGMSGMASHIAENYFGQFTSTLQSAINKTIDPVKRSTYSNQSLDSFARQQMNKIVGLSTKLEPAISLKGEIKMNEGKTLGARAALNLLSPGKVTTNKAEKEDYELLRLYEETMDDRILPAAIKKLDGEPLTPKGRTQVNMDYGKAYADEAKSFINSNDYAESNNEFKTGLLQKLQNHTKNNAHANYYNEIGLNGDDILTQKDLTANFLKERGMDNWQTYKTLSIANDLDAEGNTITNSGSLRKYIAYANQGVIGDILEDIKAHGEDKNYAYNAYGLNNSVIGWGTEKILQKWNDLLNLSATGEVNTLNGEKLEKTGKSNTTLSKKGTGSSGKKSGSGKSSAKSADQKLFEMIMKGEISATKSAVSTASKSLGKIKGKSGKEILSEHRQKLNELDLYGMKG